MLEVYFGANGGQQGHPDNAGVTLRTREGRKEDAERLRWEQGEDSCQVKGLFLIRSCLMSALVSVADKLDLSRSSGS